MANQLFNPADENLNRDGTLLPFIRLKQYFNEFGKQVNTIDAIDGSNLEPYDFISFSEPRTARLNSKIIAQANKSILVLLEPKLIRPRSYRELRKYGAEFDELYCYNAKQIPSYLRDKHRQLFFPQASKSVQCGGGKRLNKCVIIAGAHVNFFNRNENYSERIRAIASLSRYNFIDLYGRGWDQGYRKLKLNPTYVRYKRNLMKSYKGRCSNKLDYYTNYDYAICFENENTHGYITEKIFDCLLSGCIPIYKGAPNISEFIPKECFIDFNSFGSYLALYNFLKNMSDQTKQKYRDAAKKYMSSMEYLRFYNSLINIFRDDK